jgi:hypothetical protein
MVDLKNQLGSLNNVTYFIPFLNQQDAFAYCGLHQGLCHFSAG